MRQAASKGVLTAASLSQLETIYVLCSTGYVATTYSWHISGLLLWLDVLILALWVVVPQACEAAGFMCARTAYLGLAALGINTAAQCFAYGVLSDWQCLLLLSTWWLATTYLPAHRLTEEDTEYVIHAIKHVFPSHLVVQFNCTNTIKEQCLENVTVLMDLAEAVSRAGAFGLKRRERGTMLYTLWMQLGSDRQAFKVQALQRARACNMAVGNFIASLVASRAQLLILLMLITRPSAHMHLLLLWCADSAAAHDGCAFCCRMSLRLSLCCRCLSCPSTRFVTAGFQG